MIKLTDLLGGPMDRLFGLGPARVTKYEVTPLPIELPDGVTLAADHYRPAGVECGPVVLIRTPYGKSGSGDFGYGMLLARRGIQVVIQDVRGTFASEGEFDAFRQERADGIATAEWIRQQPWCDGRLAMTGASYLGFTQWAIAPYLDPPLSAITPAITASTFTPFFYPGASLALHLTTYWASLTGAQQQRLNPLVQARLPFRLNEAMRRLPVERATQAAIGSQVGFYDNVIRHAEPGTDFWAPAEHDQHVTDQSVPASMVAGWYDLFVAQQLRDFTALQQAGVPCRITIGPWIHGGIGMLRTMMADSIGWLEGQLLGDRAALQRAPVRLFLQGAERWLDFDHWPVPVDHVDWWLGANGQLGPDAPAEGTRQFRYDPADPTPTVGGQLLGLSAGPKDNRRIESRPDILIYTGQRLDHDLDLIGEVSARIVVRTEHDDADVFVRICDVAPNGRSTNVTDGIRRLRAIDPADDHGHRIAEVDLAPTAYRFRRGHRLRVQVAGGAFPNFVRNHQTGEPIATAEATRPGMTTVLHGPGSGARITLPTYPPGR